MQFNSALSIGIQGVCSITTIAEDGNLSFIGSIRLLLHPERDEESQVTRVRREREAGVFLIHHSTVQVDL